ALAFGGVLGGGSGADDGSDDPDSSTATSGDEGSDEEDADAEATEGPDPAVSFDNQAFQGNGVNVSATTPGEYALLVTYGADGDSVVAGTADATDLDDEGVAVRFQNDGGVPGTHTAHLLEGDAGGYEGGDALTAETIGNVAVADTAFVSGEGDDAETEVGFADQALGSGSGVEMEFTTPDGHFVILTYDRDGVPVVAGADDVSDLDGETRVVDVVDRDGVPGEHTAHVLANADGSQFYVPGDALSDATADVVTASATATVSGADNPEASVSFEDQALEEGTVTLTATAPAKHFVLVTYRSGDDRIVAGAEDVSGLDGESITFDLPDDGGVGGLHTAYIISEDGGSKRYAAGDVASQSTIGAAKVASTATVSE
ncbi:hypothetical protein ACFQDG_18060, partial [Natronoarchaeum mannanilyticum]